MSTLLRLFTLITIAAAGFALPMNCAQNARAAQPLAIEIPAHGQLGDLTQTAEDHDISAAAHAFTERLFDKLPLDCGDGATPGVSEHPATFDTQPSVPGYLDTPYQLTEESTDLLTSPPALTAIESRAGPPDAPPPKSID